MITANDDQEDAARARAVLDDTQKGRDADPDDLAWRAGQERSRARRSMAALAVVGVVELWSMVPSFELYHFVSRPDSERTLEAGRAIDSAVATNAIVYVVAFLVCAILFLQWFRIAVRHANRDGLHHEGGSPMGYTPGDATKYWFIPFINLVRPYEIMKRLREVSDADVLPSFSTTQPVATAGYRQAAVTSERRVVPNINVPLGLWWALYIGNGIVARVVTKYEPTTLAELKSYAIGLIASDLLGIAATVAAIMLVRGIHLNRAELYRRYAHWTVALRET